MDSMSISELLQYCARAKKSDTMYQRGQQQSGRQKGV